MTDPQKDFIYYHRRASELLLDVSTNPHTAAQALIKLEVALDFERQGVEVAATLLQRVLARGVRAVIESMRAFVENPNNAKEFLR